MIQKFKQLFSIPNSFLLRLLLLEEGPLQKAPYLNEVESPGGGGNAPQGGGFDVGGLNTKLQRQTGHFPKSQKSDAKKRTLAAPLQLIPNGRRIVVILTIYYSLASLS
ncbi:uncharacterized protein [Cicer arietinum]|uniref:Uncharacterized protein LOC101505139 n=1 Tax=Cicer arietinum TaxID=3827 RepID=A0A1S2YCI9_CICAR|nr:uncharacterized protein LOC101505139 [Cicer arietinum]